MEYVDLTCEPYPCMQDAARSLLLAVKLIRAQGLKHCMFQPHLLLKQMNLKTDRYQIIRLLKLALEVLWGN